jgi:hypothetical protein
MSASRHGRAWAQQIYLKDMMEYDRNDFELLSDISPSSFCIQFENYSDGLTGYSLDRIIDDFDNGFMCIMLE